MCDYCYQLVLRRQPQEETDNTPDASGRSRRGSHAGAKDYFVGSLPSDVYYQEGDGMKRGAGYLSHANQEDSTIDLPENSLTTLGKGKVPSGAQVRFEGC